MDGCLSQGEVRPMLNSVGKIARTTAYVFFWALILGGVVYNLYHALIR